MLAVDLDDVFKVLSALLGAIAAAGTAAASIYAYRRAQEEHARRRAEHRDRVAEPVRGDQPVGHDDPPDRPPPPTPDRPRPDPPGPNQPWQGAVDVPGAPDVSDVPAERPRWYARRERGEGNSWRRSEPLAPSPEAPAAAHATSWWQRHSRPAERAARRTARRTEAPSG